MDHHLGYQKNDPAGNNNGRGHKKVRSVHGEIGLEVPRDRNGYFDPQLINKGEKQLNGILKGTRRHS